MRYVIRQKIWCFGDDFTIRDENDQPCFLVDGRALSLGDKLSFQDLQGNELAFIKQRLLSWGWTYEIHRTGQPITVVKKELFTLFHCKFAIDCPGPCDYEASGDFLDHEYEVAGPQGPAATISKRWFAWTDHYAVEIAEGEDVILMLATAIVIDLVCHDESNKSN